MIHKVFSIYDAKAQAYLPPFILPKTEMALRIFGDCVNSPDHQFALHPEDYTLFELGTFDDEKGQFLLQRTPQSHGLGVEYRRTLTETDLDDAETIRTHPPSLSNGSPVQPGTSGDDSPE